MNLIEKLKGFFKREPKPVKPAGDGKLKCPVCKTTKIRKRDLEEAPYSRYTIPFECENLHTFEVPREGDNGY